MTIRIVLTSLILILLLATAPARAQEESDTTPPPVTPSPTPTLTPTLTPTSTETPLPSPSPTARPTETPSPSATPTVTPVWPTDTPTATVSATTAPCRDPDEPANNRPGAGGQVLVINQALRELTLTPQGDVDFFSLWAKPNTHYEITTGSGDGIDTRLRIYNPAGRLIAENDDYQSGSSVSQVIFEAASEGWYAIGVDTATPMDWQCRTYDIVATSIEATPTPTRRATATSKPTGQPTATPRATELPPEFETDPYEPNYDFETAANIGVGQTLDLNFNGYPPGASEVDNDYFRLYVKAGDDLRIETLNVAEGLDTNLIVFKEDGTAVAGNDDCEGARRSCLNWQPDYTGLAYLLAGPVGTIPDAVTADARAYQLAVTFRTEESSNSGSVTGSFGGSSRRTDVGTSTVRPTATLNAGIFGAPLPWQVTPLPPTPLPTGATPLPPPDGADAGVAFTGRVKVRPFPLESPQATPRPQQPMTIEVTIYYDENDNRAPDISEGVSGVSVRVLDAPSNRLLTQTFTDSQGYANLSLTAAGEVRLSISYLGYNKSIKAPGGTFAIRLPALHIPNLIP